MKKALVLLFIFGMLLTPGEVLARSLLASEPDEFDIRSYSYEDTLSPNACLTVLNDLQVGDSKVGTTNTIFSFNAGCSRDAETLGTELEVRFDFENDGKLDTYFSRRKLAQHKFDTSGIKNVRLDVLDMEGNISSKYVQIYIVVDEPPVPYFRVNPEVGTPGTKFIFDTKLTEDSQYPFADLLFRFDFDGDGKFDTGSRKKSNWRHYFDTPGMKNVKMEVCDPENLCSTYTKNVYVKVNTPPKAYFEAKETSKNPKNNSVVYLFDASKSDDLDEGKLRYKWDFNFTGINDIRANTGYYFGSRITHAFLKEGKFKVKLTVRDHDGAESVFMRDIVVF